MFYIKNKALQELQQISHHFAQKKDNPFFGQPMGNVHAILRPYFILYTLYPVIPYDMILYHSPGLFQISICYFFKQPAVRPNCGQLWTMGGLDNWLGCPFSNLKRHLTVILFSHLHPFSRKF